VLFLPYIYDQLVHYPKGLLIGSGASPDDFTKWEVAKIANNSPQLEIKNASRVVRKKYRNDQEQ
jgi:hypothetical protein